jgi:hypothetical protein
MMESTFTAHNDLESKLVDAHEGRIDSQAFVKELMTSQIFMPVEDEPQAIQGFQRSNKAKPLTLETEDGISVLILFTSPERAKGFLTDFPNYTGGLLSEFTWILERVGSGIGISINPGFEVGIDFEPDTVRQMIQMGLSSQNDTQPMSGASE